LENKLPKEYQLLVDWVSWINWDMLQSLSLEMFTEHQVMIDWLTGELHEWFDVYEDLGQRINQDNYMNFWFEFDRQFDKQSILDMEENKSYEIKKRYGGYTMVEVKNA